MGNRLTSGELWLRLAALTALLGGALILRVVPPESFSSFPFRASCGAPSGLPCIFCGTTRALHHLLNGRWAEAIYFNWLAFPVALIAALFAMKLLAEVIASRQIMVWLPPIRFTPRLAILGLGGIAALWLLQVSLAISLHKHELLNPSGVLYALLVR